MSTAPMLDSPAQAQQALTPLVRRVGTERVELGRASGLVLAADVVADRESPACDVSAMDGYALRCEDAGAETLRIACEAMIGLAPPDLEAASAGRVVTGAPIPLGADAVIKREDVGDGIPSHRPRSIVIPHAVRRTLRPGLNIRRKGENLRRGEIVVPEGTVINSGVVAGLAAFGEVTPLVRARVRVGLVSTGDEIVTAFEVPNQWQTRNSNLHGLAAMLSGRPWIHVCASRHAGDSVELVKEAASLALESCDAIFFTGGVSMGIRDFVPEVLEKLGARIVFHKVNQRPGKPLLGAVGPLGQLILGLPGNPASAMITARRIGLPVLAHMSGGAEPVPALMSLKEPGDKTIDLWWHRLVRRHGDGVRCVAPASSGDVGAVARSDGFVEVPPGASGPGPWPFYAWDAACGGGS